MAEQGHDFLSCANDSGKCVCISGVVVGKGKTEVKKKGNSGQLVIQSERNERDTFVTLCDQMDTSAARDIRRFMRDWVAVHTPAPDTVLTVVSAAEANRESPHPPLLPKWQ